MSFDDATCCVAVVDWRCIKLLSQRRQNGTNERDPTRPPCIHATRTALWSVNVRHVADKSCLLGWLLALVKLPTQLSPKLVSVGDEKLLAQ